MIESYLEQKENPGWTQEVALIKKSVEAANRMNPRPKFFIVCGDLVNDFPGAKDREAQVADFHKAFRDLDPEIPLVCVCGNHDVGDKPTPATVASFRSEYGPDYFSFVVGGVLMIVLNSQFFEDRSETLELAAEQDEWLDLLLKDVKNYKHAIVFQHIPWFLIEPNEEKQYFNIELESRIRMLDKFHDAGVRNIFCGHYHRNAGGTYKDLQLVVTSAVGAPLGADKSGLRIVRVQENAVLQDYYAIEDIPQEIQL